MTLCIVWRTASNINFASDSRLAVGPNQYVDSGIKVVRIPFAIHEPTAPGQAPPVVVPGDLGMACSGATTVALMMKEALAEIVRNVQGVPSYNKMDMDELADLMSRGFRVICKSFGEIKGEASAVTTLFAGYCRSQRTLRAFKMVHDAENRQTCDEVLKNAGDFEVFGSGEKAARSLISRSPTTAELVSALKQVIADDRVPGVGGNAQYGSFYGQQFEPAGVAKIEGNGVVYLRGPLDLNGPDFDHEKGLVPLFPWVDELAPGTSFWPPNKP